QTWAALGPEDWLEAFKHHPRIGDVDALRKKYAGAPSPSASEIHSPSGSELPSPSASELHSQSASELASTCEGGEQAGMRGAADDVIEGLAAGNHAYEMKFGWIFLVCATGKSAAEMLALLRARMPNDPDTELRVAAGEQAKITRIRLEKLRAELRE